MKRFVVISMFVLAFAGIAYAADIALDSSTGVANGTVTITDTFNTKSPAKNFHQVYVTTNCTATGVYNCTSAKFTLTINPGSGSYREFVTNRTTTGNKLQVMEYFGPATALRVTSTGMPAKTVFTVYSKGWN